ncbi:MAG: hypothetical protein SGCHY_001161 [Lobulomycetales sp.]
MQIPMNSGPPVLQNQTAPKKYIKINGITKLNPEYTQWQQQQTQQAAGHQPTSLANASVALPVISNMEDYMQYNQTNVASGAQERPLAHKTDQALEQMQNDPMIGKQIGLSSDAVVDGLQAILSKYEVPMGLMSKLLDLRQFDVLDFIVDDSGSMNNITDSYLPNGNPMTRWVEAITRLKTMIEIISFLPVNWIRISFLNRRDVIQENRAGKLPQQFCSHIWGLLDALAGNLPSGTTPAFRALSDSINHGQGRKVSRYFFGDGTPNPGEQQKIEHLIRNRPFPEQNPITFLSCTNEDSQVEWMKELEEIAPYCSEYDDYNDGSLMLRNYLERDEVLRDQGQALPFTRGFHLIGQLVASFNPYDLDAMDESVPLTKYMLDQLLGVDSTAEDYRHYFTLFCVAQRSRAVESKTDSVKKQMNWEPLYHSFLTNQWSMHFPQVQQFKQQLYYAEHGRNRTYVPPQPQNLPQQQAYGMQYAYAQTPQQFAPINYQAYSHGGSFTGKKKVFLSVS